MVLRLTSAQPEFSDLINPMKSNLLSIFTARIVINLRVAGQKLGDESATMDLHICDGETDVGLSMMFRQQTQTQGSCGGDVSLRATGRPENPV